MHFRHNIFTWNWRVFERSALNITSAVIGQNYSAAIVLGISRNFMEFPSAHIEANDVGYRGAFKRQEHVFPHSCCVTVELVRAAL